MATLRAAAWGCSLLALANGAPAWAQPASWSVDSQGRRFRARFDPGNRILVGAGASLAEGARAPAAAAEVGLLLRSPPPPVAAEVFWKRDHEVLRFRLRSDRQGAVIDGRLYRGTFLRHAREGALTIPTAPPLRLPFPFDVGLHVEIGGVAGRLAGPSATSSFVAEVVRAEALLDLLRSERPGRWIGVGVVGFYDVAVGLAADGRRTREHQVAPLTAIAASARAESARGLFAVHGRCEWGRPWSSTGGWQTHLRAAGALEIMPLAVNDLPVSFFIEASLGAEKPALAESLSLRVFAGFRLAAPLGN